eukprot:6319320-Alexandrium_andersonii.AAC.1
MIRPPPRSTHRISSAASDVYKRQVRPGHPSQLTGTRASWQHLAQYHGTRATRPPAQKQL